MHQLSLFDSHLLRGKYLTITGVNQGFVKRSTNEGFSATRKYTHVINVANCYGFLHTFHVGNCFCQHDQICTHLGDALQEVVLGRLEVVAVAGRVGVGPGGRDRLHLRVIPGLLLQET